MITRNSACMLWGVKGDTEQQFVLLLVSLAIQLPLACMRDMADLERMSGLAVAIDLMIVALVAYTSPWTEMKGMEQNSFIELVEKDTVHASTLFVGLGVLSFAFECQEAAFLVAGSLENPTARRWSKVTAITLSACVTLAMVCALTGYLAYGQATKGEFVFHKSLSRQCV